MNDPSSYYVTSVMGHKTSFVLQEFLLRTNNFRSKSSVRLIHPFKMQRKHRDADWQQNLETNKKFFDPAGELFLTIEMIMQVW